MSLGHEFKHHRQARVWGERGVVGVLRRLGLGKRLEDAKGLFHPFIVPQAPPDGTKKDTLFGIPSSS
jgi:hypothetical protein